MGKRESGSTAIFTTYGDYLKKYPHGYKDAHAKVSEHGYCIIDNSDKSNICWLSIASFNKINDGFNALAAMEKKAKTNKN